MTYSIVNLLKQTSKLLERLLSFTSSCLTFQDAMITVSKQMDSHTNKLFKYAKKAVHLWDVLQIGLAQQEKNLQKNLDCCRKKHDAENQVRSTPVLFLSPFLQGRYQLLPPHRLILPSPIARFMTAQYIGFISMFTLLFQSKIHLKHNDSMPSLQSALCQPICPSTNTRIPFFSVFIEAIHKVLKR